MEEVEQDVVWYDIDVNTEKQLRDLLSRRKNRIEKILEALNTSGVDYINNFGKFVTIDDQIHCKDLFENKLQYLIGSIIGKGKVGQVSLLTHNNIKLIIKSIAAVPVQYLSIRIMDFPKETENNYWKIFGEDGKRKIIAVGGDNFANQTSIHLILNLILKDSLNYIHQYDAFYCGGLGYNVIEFSNSGDLHKFLEINYVDDDLILGILSHILTPLSILKHPMYNFNHSDLKAKNVFVHKNAEGYIFKIADYDKSSITWNGFRFYNWSKNYGNSYPIKIEKDKYILTSMISINLQTMHNPYGIPMSYDIYTFIISLFAIDNVWNKYVRDELPQLKTIMHRLFLGESYYIIMGKIAQNHTAVSSITHINNMINGIYLQYDLSYVYQLVGVNPPPLTSDESKILRITVSNDGHLCTNECKVNPALNSSYKTCITNTYSKRKLTSTSLYDWDYCQ